ncbi:hypothetical protein COOONC_03412 [Cooperia oncophora]
MNSRESTGSFQVNKIEEKMFRVAVVLTLLYISHAQYGVPARQPMGSYGPVFQPPVFQPIQIKPVYLPELPPLPELLWSYPYYNRWWSRSESEEDRCDDCRPLRNACKPSDKNCEMPSIKYFKQKGCQRAIVHCSDSKNYMLMTANRKVLSNGVAIEKVIKCNEKGRWFSEDVDGEGTTFSSLRCVKVK